MRHGLVVLAVTLFAGFVAVLAGAPYAHADDARTSYSSIGDVRTAVPASMFRVPKTWDCNQYDPCNPCGKRLKISLTLVGWLTAMDGDATLAGRDVDVDLPLGDVVDLLGKVDALLQGNVRVDYGKWFARFGGSYLGLGDEIEGRVNPGPGPGIPVSGVVGLTQSYYQMIVGYNVKNIAGPRVGCRCTKIRVDAFAGVRWAEMDLSIVLPTPAIERSQDWVDPIVGGITTWDLANGWIVDLEADIGGFGVNSDLTWRLRFGAQYNLNRWLGIVSGYQFLDYDYTTGAGTSRFKWDVLTHGPYIGLNFRF